MSLLNKLSALFSSPWICGFCPLSGNVIQLNPSQVISQGSNTRAPIQSNMQGNKTFNDSNLEDCEIQFYTKIATVPADWEKAADVDNIFLNRAYLQVVEKYPPEHMQFAYWIFYHKEQAIGVAVGQVIKFNVTDNIKTEETQPEKSLVRQLKNKISNIVAANVSVNLLICGSTLLTGQHAFFFANHIKAEQQVNLLHKGLQKAKEIYAKQNVSIRGYLIKDFPKPAKEAVQSSFIKKHHYVEFEFQPSMITKIRPHWKSFDDYLGNMSSKYRVRAKRAQKKGQELEQRNLNLAAIKTNINRINELYQNVVESAEVSIAELHPNYFLGLKEKLGEKFQLTGWYLDNQLVGFHTLIHNHQEVEAHFLGFEAHLNRSHQLYLNMLYAMTAYGIEQEFKWIVFARTALEIKSSVGAEAHEMYCYIYQNSKLPNRLVNKAIRHFQPDTVWTPRHPFKD